ncbi:integrase family protein [Bradyrhizobium quebecense]|uniref:Integrase family protein n=1 Tax=Bradyrhizobium quebecense TaxID=2748629 RepID=A0A973WTR3_9BRAD|nr:integrase family protein [Bradyrhizobium quebecense]UGA43759.1 integrase family protein [Bradyrhizobium quebecense]
MRDHLLPTDKTGDNVHPSLMREPGRHCDGGGLYLEVAAPGQASWMYRYKAGWRSIGSANGYSIREARETAAKLWQAARRGEDPFALLATLRAPKFAEKPKGKLFSDALAEYLAAKSPHWAASNRARELRRYEFLFDQIPDFTALRLPEIDQDAKNKALATWDGQTKARRDVGFYIEAVIRYAETGKLRVVKVADEQEHHEAMPWRDVPAFYGRIAKLNSDDAHALRFTILTGARTDEVIGAEYKGKETKAPATWREIKEVDGVVTWVVPKDRMKGKRTHHVPLSPAAVSLLGKRRADDVPLFSVSSQNAMLDTLKTNDGNGFTVHGFRSSFSDWVIDATSYGADLADMCIAHLTRGKVRAAYQRSPQLEKRREIMAAWSDFVCGGQI